MRFCFVSTQQHWGGGEALVCSMGHELRQAGHSVSWIVRGDSEVQARVQPSGFPILHALTKRGLNPSDWMATRRVLREWVPDVVLLNDTHAVPLAGSAALFCRRPRPLRLAYKHTVFPLRSQLKYRLLSDKLVCVSHAARQTVIQGGLSQQRAVVIHGGCDGGSPDPRARQAIRGELGLSDEQALLVCVGNLLECKGHAELIEAVHRLTPSHPQLHLVIAGEGEQRGRLEQQIQRFQLQSRVRLLGYRSDATQLLAAADLVVHPSHAEGLSLVLIQAQMLRKPIVATAVGGAQEVLDSAAAGCSSWIAEPRNSRSLAAQIAVALDAIATPSPTLRQQLDAAATRMHTDFSIQASAHKFATLATSLLAARCQA